MFRAPSLQNEYSLVFSGDPALDLPEDETERENALRVARETGQWDPLIKQGEVATLFHVRPMPQTSFRWLGGEVNRRNLTPPEAAELALRLVLRSVSNLGTLKVKTAENDDGQRLATLDTIDALYNVVPDDPSIGRSLVDELGSQVILRASEGLSPKR